MSEELVKNEVVEIESPNQLIALALERQADPNTLSKLMDLQERWEAGKARKAFVAAMTAFKQEAPSVLRKGDKVDFTTVKGRTHYNYANLGSIVQEITAILGKNELSASWNTCQDGNNVTVTCHVIHVAGHRESVTLTGPIDESGNKNRIQAVGSTVTYLQRYTLLAALGLATGEDDDGRGGKPELKEPQKKANVEGKKEDPLKLQVTIKDVSMKRGIGAKGDWTLYKITTNEDLILQTFDTKCGDLAVLEKGTGMVLDLEYQLKEFRGKDGATVQGKEIVSLTRPEREPGING